MKDFLTVYLKAKNYWWDNKPVRDEDAGILRNSYLEKMEDALKPDRIVCISGIRRAGKTTLMFQLIRKLLESAEAKKIVYFKMDDLLGKVEDIRDIVSLCHELTGINPMEEQVFFFIDEIHFMKNWQLQLKYYIDAHFKSKFIISGSSKTLLYKDASESLAGRITFIDVFPLSFREFLEFNSINLGSNEFGIDSRFEDIKRVYTGLITQREKILYHLKEYLDVGGFPEWFKVKAMPEWGKLLREYLSLILFKDIVNVFKIKDALLLEKLVSEIALLSTERFSYLSLSNRLDADRETIKLYLYYLKSSMLIFTADVFTRSRRINERKEKKIYFGEEGLRKALSLETDEAKAVENIVALHLIKKGFSSKLFYMPYYWKNKYEVDFVYASGKLLLPIEVKYRVDAGDFRGMLEFMEKFKVRKGIIISRDLLEKKKIKDKEIYLIPAWLFLLLLD
ncbi:MAG: ATP-binding protein [Candidatus Woesearchaeota archaeon]